MTQRKLHIIYVSLTETCPGDVEFYAWLRYLDDCRIYYEFRNLNVSVPLDTDALNKIQGEFVYLNIPEVTLLPKLSGILPILKKNNCFVLAGGGPDIAIHYDEIMNTFREIDVIVTNPEIEKVLEQLKGKTFDDLKNIQIQGVAYRKPGNKKKFENSKSTFLSKSIDHLSSLELYRQCGTNREWYPIIVSRGCQFSCQYCGFHLPYSVRMKANTNIPSKKSERKVVDEMAFLHSKGIKKFSFFCHQFFNHREDHPNYIGNIGEEILRRKLDLEFRFSAKPSLLLDNLDQMALLKEAGMSIVDIGIDSGIARFHEMYQTGTTVQNCIDVLKYMHENNLSFDTCFIFYDPYLTVDEIKENLMFLDKVMRYYAHLSQPFSAYLDSCILNTALILRYGMPIIKKLRKDNLLSEKPGFVSHPAAKFSDRKVVLVYSIYRALNESVLKKIRHFFYDKEVVQMYPFINTFLMKIYKEILSAVSESKYGELRDCVHYILDFARDAFRPHLKDIFASFPKYQNTDLGTEFNKNE